jgi:hypothetical protein
MVGAMLNGVEESQTIKKKKRKGIKKSFEIK